MTATVASLLPCPFCGGEMMFRKALWPSDGNIDSIIHAGPASCGMVVFEDGTTDESIIAAWNRRALASEFLDEDAAVIRGLESIANDPERGLWSQSLSRGALRIIRRLATTAGVQGDDWILVSERLPADGELVEVYSPDSGDGERFDFDGMEDGAWVEHSNRREHFLMVGGAGAAGPDCVCTGPSEKAPYTHWRPLRAPGTTPPPAPAAEQGDDSAMEGWRAAVDAAQELYAKSPTHRHAHLSARVLRWIKSYRPTVATQPEARGVEAPAEDCTATEWLDFANGTSVEDLASALATPNLVRAEQPCTCPQHPDDVIPCPRHRGERPEVQGAAEEPVEYVTRESALEAIDHVGQHNGPGRASQARAMLAAAPAAPGAVGVDEATLTRWRSLIDHAPSEVQAEITAALAGKAGAAVSDTRDNDDLDDAAFAATVRDAIAGKDGA